jgi:prepilin-type N-terminal cleavage/methylation domain-containing protein
MLATTRRRRTRRAMTLIELIVAILLISAAIAGGAVAINAAQRTSGDAQARAAAARIAGEVLEAARSAGCGEGVGYPTDPVPATPVVDANLAERCRALFTSLSGSAAVTATGTDAQFTVTRPAGGVVFTVALRTGWRAVPVENMGTTTPADGSYACTPGIRQPDQLVRTVTVSWPQRGSMAEPDRYSPSTGLVQNIGAVSVSDAVAAPLGEAAFRDPDTGSLVVANVNPGDTVRITTAGFTTQTAGGNITRPGTTVTHVAGRVPSPVHTFTGAAWFPYLNPGLVQVTVNGTARAAVNVTTATCRTSS